MIEFGVTYCNKGCSNKAVVDIAPTIHVHFKIDVSGKKKK